MVKDLYGAIAQQLSNNNIVMNNALIPLMRDGYMCNEVLGQP